MYQHLNIMVFGKGSKINKYIRIFEYQRLLLFLIRYYVPIVKVLSSLNDIVRVVG